MKSLSPNALEFVPLVINNQTPAANSYYIINNGSPIAQQQHHPLTLQLGHVLAEQAARDEVGERLEHRSGNQTMSIKHLTWTATVV